MGFLVQKWPKVLGSDVAGEVHEVGKNVKRFKKGDRVVGMAQGAATSADSDGAFSLYTQVPAHNAAVLPSGVSFKDGAVLGMAIGAASSGLNLEEHLGQPFPTLDPKPTGGVVIVYGASSSIGSMTTQLASAAGIRVIAIASSKNFGLCRDCGASDVFDYKDDNVVSDVVQAVGKDTFVGVYDCISNAASCKITIPILEKLGGGKMATSLDLPVSVPDNIEAARVLGPGDHSAPIWENFVTKALESGKLKCLPEAAVVGKGLESLQDALKQAKAGVSAKKLVVEL